MIDRKNLIAQIKVAIDRSPIVALVGPRQCGKTTIAKVLSSSGEDWPDGVHFFDLESPFDQTRLDNPMFTLEPLRGLVVIDEVQRATSLFPVLRVLADRPGSVAKFLLLGSSSPDLLWNSSESLAGRIEFVEMQGFSLSDIGADNFKTLWTRGGLPPSFVRNDKNSFVWRENFIRTFLERDLRQLGSEVSPTLIGRFWNMLAHNHGQRWNGSEIASSLGVSATTARRYLDLMTGAFMVRQLQPWHENMGKRQVKAPKTYIRDTGILHSLLGLPDDDHIAGHPKMGASWEGFCIEIVSRFFRPRDIFHWGIHSGPELDMLVHTNGKRIGFEFKCSDTPKITSSMKASYNLLNLDSLYIVYPGPHSAPLAKGFHGLSVQDMESLLSEIGQI